MSNIYIQEPPTQGKVLLKTTVGELEIELWSKEAPKTCRKFLQLCMDRKYDKTLFHRLMSNFIVQCGESPNPPDIEPIKNEIHSRLRFSRRGLVAMAQNEGADASMEFFFTLDQTPELQNKHTIFGKVSGETVYNMLKLNETPTDGNDRPVNPHRINKVKILMNPFEDLVPTIEAVDTTKEESKKAAKKEGVKNFKLISFGDEAEQDEEELVQEVKKFPKEIAKPSEPLSSSSTSLKVKKDKERSSKSRSVSVLRGDSSSKGRSDKKPQEAVEDSDSDYEATKEKEKLSELEKKRKEIQDQINEVKKQYQKDRKEKNSTKEVSPVPVKAPEGSEVIKDYLEEKEKYKKKKSDSKGATREAFTLSLLAKFKNKLHTALETEPSTEQGQVSDDENWLGHKLDFSESADAVLAKDASKKQDDWYDIYDPRNPLNKRKRGAEKPSQGETSSKRKT